MERSNFENQIFKPFFNFIDWYWHTKNKLPYELFLNIRHTVNSQELINVHDAKDMIRNHFNGKPDQHERKDFINLLDETMQRIEAIQYDHHEVRKILNTDDHSNILLISDERIKYLTALRGVLETGRSSFIINGIDIPALTEELLKRGYFAKDDQAKVQSWFNGIRPDGKINSFKPANHFCTLIALLIEKRHIGNTNDFCINYIYDSFTFRGRNITVGSIQNVISRKIKRIPLFDLTPFIA